MLMLIGSGKDEDILQISSAEVNQALGVQKDAHSYYVAGKNTVIRAFLNKAVMIDEKTTGVSVKKDSQHVFNMSPKITGESVTSVDFVCSSLEGCQNWAAGSYSFEMSVNGTDFSLGGPFSFITKGQIRILAVPVKAKYGTVIKSVTGDDWKKLGQFTQNVYPLAEGNFKWTNRLKLFDASSYNIETEDGQESLSIALSGLIPAECKTNPKGAGCYDYVVGMIPEVANGNEGWAFMSMPAVVVVAGSNDAAGTVAHEIAHKYGIGDTYDSASSSSIRCSVNPAPDGFKGKDWDNNMQPFNGCTAGRLKSTLIGKDKEVINGAQVAASAHPYEWNRGYLGEKADFMSAGGAWQSQLWITQDNYDYLFGKLNDSTAKGVSRILGESATENRFVSYSGIISKTGEVELDPWESYTDTATLIDTTGEYMVKALDATDTVLASSAFTVQFFSVHPPRDLDRVYFEGVVSFPEGTAKFQILKGIEVLKELSVSATKPTVSNVTPTASVIIDSSYDITWTASDSEGGPLTYTVSYNPDTTNADSPWIILADEIDTKFWEEDFGYLPGGSHARIRVTASDGILCGSAQSASFVVPTKSPEVFIGDLPAEGSYIEGNGITLSVDVFDLQDESFDESSIKWTSSISGNLGTGFEILIKDLPLGTQIIKVTATNSVGLSDSDEVSIEVSDGGSSDSGGGKGGLCFLTTASSELDAHME